VMLVGPVHACLKYIEPFIALVTAVSVAFSVPDFVAMTR
jgi:hypothetical protein